MSQILAKEDTAFQNPPDKIGEIVWAKLTGCKWWPAITVNSSDCGRPSARYGYTWVFWFGDHKISEVPKQKIYKFVSLFHEMNKIPSTKLRHKAISEALEILADMASYSYDTIDDLVLWAKSGFENLHVENNSSSSLPPIVIKFLDRIAAESEEGLDNIEDNSQNVFEKIETGELKIGEFCISCHRSDVSIISEHPFFKGSLCMSCKDILKESVFALGDDGKNICCIICGLPGLLILCDNLDCSRSYCCRCLNFFVTREKTKQIMESPMWNCFFCSPNEGGNSFLQIHANWEDTLMSLFSPENSVNEISLSHFIEKKPIVVLSLFDGISTGKLVLDMLGIVIDKYFSSEIDEAAIHVSKFHNLDSIIYIGDVCNITEYQIETYGQIDLVIGGSPCNDLSLVNPARKGLYDFTGTGCLFFDFFHILNIVRRKNPNVLYLFENVAAMRIQDRTIISSFLMHEPALIDAKYFSPQNRARYFWGNIPGLHSLPKYWSSVSSDWNEEHSLTQCILPNMGRKAMVEKIKTITTQRNSMIQEQGIILPVMMNGEPDVLWVTELEKIFGFPLHYTDTGNLGITKRRELLGRSWSVPVIKIILQPLKSFFLCR